MARHKDNWAKHIPEPSQRGPYRSFGSEAGQSSHPAFRDPSVQLTLAEREEIERRRELNERSSSQPAHQPGGRMHVQSEDIYAGYSSRDYDEQGGQDTAKNRPASGSFAGVGPRRKERTDEDLRDEVCRRLTQHGRLDARNIEVQVEYGEVALVGSVHDRKDKRRAENVALSVPGIWDVHNRLQCGSRDAQANRVDVVGHSGVHPVSGPLPEDDAPVVDMDSWANKD